jgi:tetratricopeptide (TPR) repeat protein
MDSSDPGYRSDTAARHGRLRRWAPWALVGGSLACLILVVAGPLWLPPVLRQLVPDRYLAAYAPQPLQALIFRHDPLRILPTAPPVDALAATSLLEQIAALDTPVAPVVTPTPAAQTVETTTTPGSVTPQPAPPTPTLGPGFVPAIGEGNSPAPTEVLLEGFRHEYQGWNNCGPTTIAMAASHWGVSTDQWRAAEFLKPNPEDRNVSPSELAAYARNVGLDAIVRINGDINLLRALIAAGYPVMIEKGFNPEPDELGWMGHYLLLVGFSDPQQVFITMDSYWGPEKQETYTTVESFWRNFNRVYIVVFPAPDRAAVEAIIGSDMDDTAMYTRAAQVAQQEITQVPDDPFGWFNLGSSLAGLGDATNAAVAFDIARSKGIPWRMLWYQFAPYEAYLAVGGPRLLDVITLADAVLQNNEQSEEAYYYKGLALAAQGYPGAAAEMFEQALSLNPGFTPAVHAQQSLPPQG